jgi:hypothetical protein
MAKKTLKEHLMLVNEITDPSDIDSLWECFVWGEGKQVWEGDYDEHRWYINSQVVMKFVIDGEERFFEYTNCNTKEEESTAEDCGWEKPDLDDLCEVYPKEVTTTIYVTANRL